MCAQEGVTCLTMLSAVASTRRNVGRGRQAPITQASKRALPTWLNAGHVWPQRLRQAAFFSRKLQGSPMPRQKLTRSQSSRQVVEKWHGKLSQSGSATNDG